ncbi:hypothetical protein ACTFIU_005366 [Dictyostelium citrinum]
MIKSAIFTQKSIGTFQLNSTTIANTTSSAITYLNSNSKVNATNNSNNKGSASTTAGNNSTTITINESEITDNQISAITFFIYKNYFQHKGRRSPLNIRSGLNYILQQ